MEPKGTQTEKELEGLNGIDEPAMHESVIRNCLEVSNESRDSKKYDGNVCESPREATSYDLIEEVRITAIRQENMEVENTEIFVESGEPNEPNFQKRIQHTDVDDSSTNKILTIEEPIAPNAVILSLPEECGPVDQVKEGKMTAQFLNSNGDANCCEEAFTAPLSGTFCISHDIGKSYISSWSSDTLLKSIFMLTLFLNMLQGGIMTKWRHWFHKSYHHASKRSSNMLKMMMPVNRRTAIVLLMIAKKLSCLILQIRK